MFPKLYQQVISIILLNIKELYKEKSAFLFLNNFPSKFQMNFKCNELYKILVINYLYCVEITAIIAMGYVLLQIKCGVRNHIDI